MAILMYYIFTAIASR